LFPHRPPEVGIASENPRLNEHGLVLSGFVERAGDSTPLVASDGSMYFGRQLVADAIEALSCSVRSGRPPETMAVAVPGHWNSSTIDALGDELRWKPAFCRRRKPLPLVPDAVAALIAIQAQTSLPSRGTVLLCDFGATGTSITLADAAAGFSILGETVRYHEFSGDLVDQAVLRLATADAQGEASSAPFVTASDDVRDHGRRAKERLSSETATGFVGPRSLVRLTRADLEALLREPLDGVVGAVEDTVRRSGISPADLVAAVAVGGGARIPLVTLRLSQALGVPVITAPRPNVLAAVGASLFAARGLTVPVASGLVLSEPTLQTPAEPALQLLADAQAASSGEDIDKTEGTEPPVEGAAAEGVAGVDEADSADAAAPPTEPEALTAVVEEPTAPELPSGEVEAPTESEAPTDEVEATTRVVGIAAHRASLGGARHRRPASNAQPAWYRRSGVIYGSAACAAFIAVAGLAVSVQLSGRALEPPNSNGPSSTRTVNAPASVLKEAAAAPAAVPPPAPAAVPPPAPAAPITPLPRAAAPASVTPAPAAAPASPTPVPAANPSNRAVTAPPAAAAARMSAPPAAGPAPAAAGTSPAPAAPAVAPAAAPAPDAAAADAPPPMSWPFPWPNPFAAPPAPDADESAPAAPAPAPAAPAAAVPASAPAPVAPARAPAPVAPAPVRAPAPAAPATAAPASAPAPAAPAPAVPAPAAAPPAPAASAPAPPAAPAPADNPPLCVPGIC
jgi:hypothetical protein